MDLPSPSRNVVSGKARAMALRDSLPGPEAEPADTAKPGPRSGPRAQLEALRRITPAGQTHTIARPLRKQS
jgi:hypothetical protein